MDKKTLIEVLNRDIDNTITQLHLQEVDYRLFNKLSLAAPRDNSMAGARTKAYQTKQILTEKLKESRQLLEEVKDGRFTV